MGSTQFIVLSGNETAQDARARIDRLDLPNPVTISYRHVSLPGDAFALPLLDALRDAGVSEIATLFAAQHAVDRLAAQALERGIAVTAS